MSAQNQVPEVTFAERDDSQSIRNAPIGIGGMLGITQRGVPNKRKRVQSWKDYTRSFGGFLATSDLPLAAKRALDQACAIDVVRTVHLDGSGLSTAVAAFKQLLTSGGGASAAAIVGTVVGTLWQGLRTWSLLPGQTFTVKVDGGGNLVATVVANQASALSAVAPYVANSGQTILYKTSAAGPVRTITLSGSVTNGAVTVQQLLNEFAAQGVGISAALSGGTRVQVSADVKGTSSYLEFTGGTALTACGIPVAVNSPAGGSNVADADHTTAAELDAMVKLATTNAVGVTASPTGFPTFTHATTGSGHSIQFVNGGANDAAAIAALGIPDTAVHAGTSNSAVNTLLLTAGQYGSPDPGTWANGAAGVSFDVGLATRSPSSRFKLTVYLAGVLVDTLDELTMIPTDDRYVVKVLANHPYLVATDSDAYGVGGLADYTLARPAVQTGTTLLGGVEGSSAVVAADYQGDSVKKSGFYAFDTDKDASFVAMPGYTDRATQQALTAYCELRGDLLAVLDVPANLTPAQWGDWRQATGAYAGQGSAFNTSYGAGYGPRIVVTDPVTKVPRAFSPAGDVFAAYANAKIDAQASPAGATAGPEGGKVSAGTPPALRLEQDFDIDSDGPTILGFGLNPIINHPVYGLVIWGERDLQASASDMDRVPQRRWDIYAKQSLKPVVEPVVLFQPNDKRAWAKTKLLVAPWLRQEVARRAITDAKWVNDETVNSALDIAAHKQSPQLLVKHSPHAEFVLVTIVNVSQDTVIAA